MQRGALSTARCQRRAGFDLSPARPGALSLARRRRPGSKWPGLSKSPGLLFCVSPAWADMPLSCISGPSAFPSRAGGVFPIARRPAVCEILAQGDRKSCQSGPIAKRDNAAGLRLPWVYICKRQPPLSNDNLAADLRLPWVYICKRQPSPCQMTTPPPGPPARPTRHAGRLPSLSPPRVPLNPLAQGRNKPVLSRLRFVRFVPLHRSAIPLMGRRPGSRFGRGYSSDPGLYFGTYKGSLTGSPQHYALVQPSCRS